MNFLNNIGVEFTSNYLLQGNVTDKINVAKKAKIKNICLNFKTGKENIDYDIISKKYDDNVIIHLPTISYNLNNLKKVTSIVQKLVTNNVNFVTINTTNLTMEEFEFSEDTEKKEIFDNITTAIATLASNKIRVGIENPTYKGNTSGHFGQDLNYLTDIIVYSRNRLIEEFNFTESDANKYIGISFNVSNLIKNKEINEVNKWFDVLNKDIMCIKMLGKNADDLINIVLSNCLKYEINCPILFHEECELEEISDKFIHYSNLVKVFNKDNNVKGEKEEIIIESNGYADMICLSIIVVTILIAILMVYVKFKA